MANIQTGIKGSATQIHNPKNSENWSKHNQSRMVAAKNRNVGDENYSDIPKTEGLNYEIPRFELSGRSINDSDLKILDNHPDFKSNNLVSSISL